MKAVFVILSLLIPLVFPAASRAAGPELTVSLASDHVDITTGFSGGRIMVFGTKPVPGDIAVVVSGPEREMRVRRKETTLGLWMNRRAVTFHSVPIYYDYATSRAEADLAPMDVRQENRIGLDALIFDPETTESPEDLLKFQEGLIRSQQTAGLYPLEAKPIVFLTDTFFRATLDVPSNVPTGEYTIRTFLIRDGRIDAVQDLPLRVAQVGFPARVYLFAHENGLMYGLCAVLMAVAAGVGANLFLRRD